MPHGALRFVGDVKYKIVDYSVYQADLYQLLAYIVAANLPSWMLIYPKGEVEPKSLSVANIGRTIEICTLDISNEPKEILASVNRIAARVRSIARRDRERSYCSEGTDLEERYRGTLDTAADCKDCLALP